MTHIFKQTLLQFVRLEKADLLECLNSFGRIESNILLVHSSLSHCGYVVGGPQAVVEVLCQWVSGCILAMPTHSYCYPDKKGDPPVFDVQSTASAVGAVTDYFWRLPQVARSIHPTHSLACLGPMGESLCQGHELCDTPCGAGTPYERLIQRDSSVLMFGTTLNVYTLFHTAEDAARVPYLYEQEPYSLKFKGEDGRVQTMMMKRHDMNVPRAFSQMDSWLERRGLLVKNQLGCGTLMLIPHSGWVHEAVMKELRRDPLFLVAESARSTVARRFGL